jgi:hypothetical protein
VSAESKKYSNTVITSINRINKRILVSIKINGNKKIFFNTIACRNFFLCNPGFNEFKNLVFLRIYLGIYERLNKAVIKMKISRSSRSITCKNGIINIPDFKTYRRNNDSPFIMPLI